MDRLRGGGKREDPLYRVTWTSPLPQRKGRKEVEERRGAPQRKEAFIETGLTLREAVRQVEAYPPGLEEKNRAEHDALIMDLTPVLESINL